MRYMLVKGTKPSPGGQRRFNRFSLPQSRAELDAARKAEPAHRRLPPWPIVVQQNQTTHPLPFRDGVTLSLAAEFVFAL